MNNNSTDSIPIALPGFNDLGHSLTPICPLIDLRLAEKGSKSIEI